MRALRERPRVTVAKLLAVLLVFAAGAAFAAARSDDAPGVPPSTARALSKAERAADTRADRLATAGEEAQRLESRLLRSQRGLRASAARNRRLARSLGSARRQLRRLQP